MKLAIETLLEEFEQGEISRRQFVAYIAAFAGILAGVGKGFTKSEQFQSNSLFRVSELNHLALRVTDLDRSQKFYEDVLGMNVILKRPNMRFMGCGPHFIALFKGSEPRLDHLAFTLPGYKQKEVAKKLRTRGIEPHLEENRTYFRDSDGYMIQVEHPDAWPGGGRRSKHRG